ncbi:MAG: hypothetical protein ABI862_14770 [Ilumatobacteraceae bacterium]
MIRLGVYAARDLSNLLLGRADDTFTDGAEAEGIVSFDRAGGAALVDLNLDVMPDLVVVNRQANVKLWRNVGSGDAARPAPMGHWIAVQLRQAGPNVDAIGTWLEVRIGERTVLNEVTVGADTRVERSAGSTRNSERSTARRFGCNGRAVRPGHG